MRSSQPSWKMSGLAFSMASNAPSENLPSGKDSEGDCEFDIEVAEHEVRGRLLRHAALHRLVHGIAHCR